MDESDLMPSPEPFVALAHIHTKAVLDCCFSPLTEQILTAGEDGKVVLWNIPPTDTVLHDETINDDHKLVCHNLADHKTPVTSVSMQKDVFVAASKTGQAMLWRLRPTNQGEPISRPVSYTCHTRIISSCTLSLDTRSFATGSDDRTIKVWSTESKNKCIVTLGDGHANWIRCVRWCKTNDSLLASCGDDYRLCIWDAREKVRKPPLFTLQNRTKLLSLDWHPIFEHHIVTGGHDGSCTIWDLRTRKRAQFYNEHTQPVNSVAFNPGGSLLLTGSSDSSSRIYDCLEGRNVFNLLAHKSDITSACFDPCDSLFATASSDKTVTIWKRNFDIVTIIQDRDEGESEFTEHSHSGTSYQPSRVNGRPRSFRSHQSNAYTRR